MKIVIARLATGLLAVLALAPPALAQHPNQAQGFRPENAFQVGQLQHVNLFNGNLTLTLPIGQRYTLGPKLSYGLTLVYTGNVWNWEQRCKDNSDPGTCYFQALPRTEDGESVAGLGWDLTLGKFLTHDDPANSSPDGPVYLGPDQAYHVLHDQILHPGSGTEPGFSFSQDSTYLRFDNAAARLEFPDGTYQQFETLQGRSRLTEMGDPYGHTLTIAYSSYDTTAHHFLLWTLTDSYHRTHTLQFTTRAGGTVAVVSRVTLETFGGTHAAYNFSYQDVPLPRACNVPTSCTTNGCVIANATVPLLTQVTLPDDSSYGMPVATSYHVDSAASCTDSSRNLSGVLEKLKLPTGGAFEWDWRVWGFPRESGRLGVLKSGPQGPPFDRAVGLAARRWIQRGGATLGTWTYRQSLVQDASTPRQVEERVDVTDPQGAKSEHYFSVYADDQDVKTTEPAGWHEEEYGLPFTRRVSDGTSPGRYLSSRVFDKGDHLLRSTYVRYERSGGTKANPRLASERTVYHDDAGRHADLDETGFDGLGHYRTQTYSGTFGAGTNARTVSTDFNPTRSVSSIPGTGEPWILDTYDLRQTTEAGRTVTEEADFEAATGFLLRTRRRQAAACGGHDVVVSRVRFPTRDAQNNLQPDAGFPAREDVFGGDSQTLACGALATLALPAQPVYRQKHTYVCGSLATSRWFVPGGNALSFLSADRTIDCSSGLAASSRDTAGLATTYHYDTLSRLTQEDLPAGEGQAVHIYAHETASSPAKVATRRKSPAGTVLAGSQVLFDGFGRLAEEQRTLPDGSTTVRTSAWTAQGWLDQRSTWHLQGASGTKTFFSAYDPFGRPGTVTLPDGRRITIDYAGKGRRSISVPVATAIDPTTNEPILSSATTTEVYDHFGRLARLTEPDGTRTSYTYGPQDELTQVRENDLGTPIQTRSFTYDGRGFLTSETHPELGTSVVYSGYDPLGNPGRIRRGGQDLSYAYDAAGRLTAITETGTSRVWKSWTYATANTHGSSNGKLVAASRLNRLPYPPAPSVIIEPRVSETYTYGGVGGRISHVTTRVENVGDPDTHTQPVFEYSLAYDPLGDVASRTYPDCSYLHCSEATASHVVTQGFTAGLLTSVPQFASAITYHPNGLWAHVAHTNGVTDVQEADVSGLGRPGRLSTTGASDNFDSGAIAYDGAGNVTKMGADRYVYDLLSRVSEAAVEVPHESCGQLTVVQGKTDTTTKSYQSCGTVQAGPGYTVGSGGNVTLTAGHQVVFASGFSVASGGRLAAGVDPALDPPGQPTAAGQTYTFDRFGNLTQITTSREGHADEVQGIGTFSNTNRLSAGGYDDAGNLISFPGVSWTYDPFNMMTQEASSAGSHFDFVYGPGDERLWTIDWSAGAAPSNWRETWTLRDLDGSPLRQYVSIGGNNAQANWQAASPDFPRDYAWRGGSLLASVTQAGILRHDHLDHLGSPRIVTDAAGKTLARHLYFPFGQEATEPDQDDLALKFTGHERDDLDSGGTSYDLDYMHRRFFSPQVGRFLSTDPVAGNPSAPQSWNLYAYTLGNPVKYTDPRGMDISGLFEDVLRFIPEQYTTTFFDSTTVLGAFIQIHPNAQTGVGGLGELIGGRFLQNSLAEGGPGRGFPGQGLPKLIKAMAAVSCPKMAQGFSIDVSTINPWSSGGGIIAGLNLEWVPGSGLGLYGYYTPPAAKRAGFDAGIALTANAAIGSGPWTGDFLSAVGNFEGLTFGGFGPAVQQPSGGFAQSGTGWYGLQAGGSGGPPGIAQYTTRYRPVIDLGFLTPWCQ